jgi:nucleoid-associated protein YgaU
MNKVNKILLGFLSVGFVAGCATPEPVKEPAPAAPEAVQEVRPAPAPAPAPVARPEETYTVVRGDHLWGISSRPKIYGNPYQWPLLFKANRDKIRDADLIEPGQVFTIDRNASQADIDAAVRHARTRGPWRLGVMEESDKAYLAKYGLK